MTERPRLTPAMADVRRAIRENLTDLSPDAVVFVALSGGPDSLALAAGLAFEAPRAGLLAGAVIVDHGLQRLGFSIRLDDREERGDGNHHHDREKSHGHRHFDERKSTLRV